MTLENLKKLNIGLTRITDFDLQSIYLYLYIYIYIFIYIYIYLYIFIYLKKKFERIDMLEM
jgi:hypothetical protein